jgi:hypothetical protein
LISRIHRQGEKGRELSEEKLVKKDALPSGFVGVECRIMASAESATHYGCISASWNRDA